MSGRTVAADWLMRQWLRRGWFARMMKPLSILAAAFVRHQRKAYSSGRRMACHPGIPVIGVGNLFVGGTGKTPVVIALVEGLRARGLTPGILSRGYGVEVGPVPRVGQGNLDATRFGDEPALIARQTGAPMAVHPRRAEAAQALRQVYPEVDVLISDDGLQHLALARDIEIVVQDTRGIGNGLMMPAGPLREPADRLSEVDVVITNLGAHAPVPSPRADDSEAETTHDACPVSAHKNPPLAVALRLTPEDAVQLTTGQRQSLAAIATRSHHHRVQAAAGIGQPERFFDMLKAAGIELAGTRALPDHHDWRGETFDATIDMVLVTAKDAVKCGHLDDLRFWEVPVAPRFVPIDFVDRIADRVMAGPNLH